MCNTFGEKEEGGRTVLCGANVYEKKYYFNRKFDGIPPSIKDELHIICVLFTEEVGGFLPSYLKRTGASSWRRILPRMISFTMKSAAV